MIPIIALNLVELLESFKIPNLSDYDFIYYGLPDDPLRYRNASMVFIDMDKALILPGTECVILCARKHDRETVTAVKITSSGYACHVEIERYAGSIEVGVFMEGFDSSKYVNLSVDHISGEVDRLAKSNPAAVWENAHTRQTQLNTKAEFSSPVQSGVLVNEFAKKKLNEIRNIEDFGVANPKPC